MRWAEGFIAVDWGTTNRRAYLIDRDGCCRSEFEDGKGVLSVEPDGFPAAISEIRTRLADHPLLLAGMVGSNRGWIEAPYAPCPASLRNIADRLVWADDGRCAIVPGVCFRDGERADVMRGEEVQLLGAAAAGLIPADCLVCHPGTHNKWARLSAGEVVAFRTVMTGELFNLLKEHSILAELLAQSTDTGEAFRAGVRHGLAQRDLTAELFSVRARVLLDVREREQAASYVSGLLVGADVHTGLEDVEGEIVIMGRPELTARYRVALEEAGRTGREVDGETAFLAGIKQLAELIE